MKSSFYQEDNLQNITDSSIIHTLLRLIENNTDENKVEDVLFELRELNDRHFRNDIQETINNLTEENKICPICGGELLPTVEMISHSEIDGNFKEESFFYTCEDCGFDDRDNY